MKKNHVVASNTHKVMDILVELTKNAKKNINFSATMITPAPEV